MAVDKPTRLLFVFCALGAGAVLIAVLALVLGARYESLERGTPWENVRATRNRLWVVRTALDAYAENNVGRYPPELETIAHGSTPVRIGGETPLEAYIELDAEGNPVIDETFRRDGWGRPWIYALPAAPDERPRVMTLGRDGEPGGHWWNADLDLSSVAERP